MIMIYHIVHNETNMSINVYIKFSGIIVIYVISQRCCNVIHAESSTNESTMGKLNNHFVLKNLITLYLKEYWCNKNEKSIKFEVIVNIFIRSLMEQNPLVTKNELM